MMLIRMVFRRHEMMKGWLTRSKLFRVTASQWTKYTTTTTTRIQSTNVHADKILRPKYAYNKT